MPDNNMAEMMKILIEQNKAMREMMENQSDENQTTGPSNLAKRPLLLKYSNIVKKIKVSRFKMIHILRLPVLAAPGGSRPNEDICTESDNANLTK